MNPVSYRSASNRIATIDVIRGLVMVVMALDHVRDLLHITAISQNPTDLATTTAPIFLTRWITHLCAPTFVFLSGTSAYLSLRNRNTDAARWFLLRRGLVLIVLEVTIINFAFWFDIQFRSLLLQVIFAIGGGLVLLALLSKLPVKSLAIMGLVIIFGHDLLLTIPPFGSQAIRFVSALLFRVDAFPFTSSFMVVVGYPLIPWFGIMLVGYALGPLLERGNKRRNRLIMRLGLAALGAFVLLRFINIYGDPAPRAGQRTSLFTLLSFINVSKYPPSLLYALLMLGIMLVLLSIADGVDNAFTRWLTVYGRVPLFYYVIHWYAVHGLMMAMVLLQGYSWTDIQPGTLSFGRPAGAGLSLGPVYLVWMGLVAALYPLCRWYGRFKSNHPEIGWLRYV